MLETVWCAVSRRTRSGQSLGQEEAISRETALKAVTLWAAWQYGEEKEKGSIAPGKRADLVILEKNPLEVPEEELRSIRILETLKDGETVWKREKG